MRMASFFRLWRTVKHLRPQMVWARLWRPVQLRFFRPKVLPANVLEGVQKLPALQLPAFPEADKAEAANSRFCFLNREHRFSGGADWNFMEEGLLWNYHLNSFVWLERLSAPEAAVDALLQNRAAAQTKKGNEGYPTARRLRHGIRYVLLQQTRDAAVIRLLWNDAQLLAAAPEKHLNANHLLENYLSLWAAGIFFNHAFFLRSATAGLLRELPQQFLKDGAHYERSTHYTAQLLAGILRGLALQKRLGLPAENNLADSCKSIVSRGLGWLAQVQFADGQMPAFGDAHRHLWPSLKALQGAAAELEIKATGIPLSGSGYRSLESGDFSLRANVGTAGPRFQPGHSGADALSFALYFRGKPLLTDTGISTYARNARRQTERSTEAHNTVVVNGKDSAEVWASFRMGRRAQVALLSSTDTVIEAEHNGYRNFGVVHRRQFLLQEEVLKISDRLSGKPKAAWLYLHFHPGVCPQFVAENTLEANGCLISWEGLEEAQLAPYEWAAGFNSLLPAVRFCARLAGKGATLTFKAATLAP